MTKSTPYAGAVGYSYRALPVGNVFNAQWRLNDDHWRTIKSGSVPVAYHTRRQAEKEALATAKSAHAQLPEA